MGGSTIHVGDCLEWLRSLPDESVDSVVTDPPYGLGKEPDPREVLRAWLDGEDFRPGGRGFMGKEWDAFVPSPLVWAECFRVLKPGGHLLSFASTRTYDWIVMAVRLAGFEIRDQLAWIYGTGFPKSSSIGKAIDRAAGAERRSWGHASGNRGIAWPPARETKCIKGGSGGSGDPAKECAITAPATPDAERWDGWGTALKPAQEPIVMARKPFRGSVAANVLEHGTGAINVDGCRVGTGGQLAWDAPRGLGYQPDWSPHRTGGTDTGAGYGKATKGRWPANVIHDGSPEVVSGFPVTKVYSDTGSAARFFYSPKASRKEREWGLDALGDYRGNTERGLLRPRRRRNIHPTVKPVALIGYLQRLVTPPGGLTIDPYLGSGTAAMAATWEGFRFRGCELDTAHATIAQLRYQYAQDNPCPYRQPDPEPEASAQTSLFGDDE